MKIKCSLFSFLRQLFSVGHGTAEWNKSLHVKIIEMSSECIELQSLVEELENENVQMLIRRNLTHKELMDFIYKKYPTLLTSAGLINIKKIYELFGPYSSRVREKDLFDGLMSD